MPAVGLTGVFDATEVGGETCSVGTGLVTTGEVDGAGDAVDGTFTAFGDGDATGTCGGFTVGVTTGVDVASVEGWIALDVGAADLATFAAGAAGDTAIVGLGFGTDTTAGAVALVSTGLLSLLTTGVLEAGAGEVVAVGVFFDDNGVVATVDVFTSLSFDSVLGEVVTGTGTTGAEAEGAGEPCLAIDGGAHITSFLNSEAGETAGDGAFVAGIGTEATGAFERTVGVVSEVGLVSTVLISDFGMTVTVDFGALAIGFVSAGFASGFVATTTGVGVATAGFGAEAVVGTVADGLSVLTIPLSAVGAGGALVIAGLGAPVVAKLA
jgi:hypothetical protein